MKNKLTSVFNNFFINITSNVELKNPPTKKANGNLNGLLENVFLIQVSKSKGLFHSESRFQFHTCHF